MKSKKRLKLAAILIVSALLVSFTIATIDYLRHKQVIKETDEFFVNQVEATVVDSIMTVEKAHALFDSQTKEQMQKHMQTIEELYQANPHFSEWNFQELTKDLGMDVYIINADNVVTHSNLQSDVGMDFKECCQTLSGILDERRESGEFFADQMDIEQETGEVKMYSYQATSDHQYLIELGLNLQEGEIFKEFDFFTVIEKLKQNYGLIDDIHILNMGGLALGKTAEEMNISEERRAAFKEALQKHEVVEIAKKSKGDTVFYRYIPYISSYDSGSSQNKVIEIIHNNKQLQATIKDNRKIFFLQLFVVLTIIIIITFVIHRWVAKQVYFAYHDGLTRLKNRAALNEYVSENLEKGEVQTFAFMMLDLDNFKLVNDYLGHKKGDYLLQIVGQSIQNAVRGKGEIFRLGGDEFAVILPQADCNMAERVAKDILKEMSQTIDREQDVKGLNITASIGICLAPDHGIKPDLLYEKADIALYQAKKKGKNQYLVS